MKKNIKKFLIIILISFFILLGLLIRNRYTFSVWNPFSLPDRMECYNRRYYISNFSPKILKGNKKPEYPISSSDNRTGKDLYTQYPKGQYVPTVIYLKMNNGKYQLYSLSGGP